MFYIILYKHELFDKILIYIHEICKIHDIPFTICIYGECCKDSIPCKKGAFYQVFREYTQFQKNKQDIEVNPYLGDKYIVFYQKDILQKYESDFMNRNHQQQESEMIPMNQFLSFMKEQQKYYQQFCQEWILQESTHKIIIEYHDFQTQPLKCTMDFLQFLYPHFLFDQTKIYQMIRNFEKDFTSISFFDSIQSHILEKNKSTINSNSNIMSSSEQNDNLMNIDSDIENIDIQHEEDNDIIELIEEIKEIKISESHPKKKNSPQKQQKQPKRKIPHKVKQRQIQKLQKDFYIARYKKDKKLMKALQKLIHLVRKT